MITDLADRSLLRTGEDRRALTGARREPQDSAAGGATATWTGTAGRCRPTSPRTTGRCTQRRRGHRAPLGRSTASLAPGSVERVGRDRDRAEPLPAVPGLGCRRHIDAVDAARPGVGYLARQLAGTRTRAGRPSGAACRALNPALPATADRRAGPGARRCRATPSRLAGADYDLASMHFVAESVTEDPRRVRRVLRGVRRDGPTGRPSRRGIHGEHGPLRAGRRVALAGLPVDGAAVARVFGPLTRELRVSRIDADPGCPTTATPGWCC